MYHIKILAAVLGAASFVAPAQAQVEQTPEGAVAFFQTVIEQGQIRGSFRQSGEWDPVFLEVPDNDVAETIGDGKSRIIEKVEFRSNCAMTLYLKTPLREHSPARNGRVDSYRTYNDVPPIQIDFSKIQGVASNEESYVVFTGTEPRFRFVTSSEALKARVAYAAEFLRQHCDKAAATGF